MPGTKKPKELPNIVEIAGGSDDFNILVKALTITGLLDTVEALDDITVFAPTDAAFGQLAVDLGFDGDPEDESAVFHSLVASLTELSDGEPVPLLADILLYHVSAGAKTAAEIDALDAVPTFLTDATFGSEGTELVDNEPDVTNPNIIAPDIDASNGTIQVIDRVLIPIDIEGNEAPEAAGTLTEIVAASGGVFDDDNTDFDILLNAVIAAELDGALNDPDADLTVFAPNDAAFIGLAQTLGFEGSDEAEAFTYIVDALTLLTGGGDPIALLTDILLYHVVPESLDSTEVLSATSIPTLLGETLGVDGLELVDNDPDIPNPELIETDILATNGIAHVLDGVLIPVDILNGDGGKGKVNFEIGGDGNDVFRTGANTDFVFGKDGSDFIRLGRGDDVGLGGAGNDNIRGGRGEDIVKGGDGNDTLGGGRDDDALYGGAGRDLLIGGRNDDLLTGGADADTFRFNAHSGHDTITDFMSGEDLIQIQVRKMRDFDDLEKRITNTEDGALIDLGRAEILLAGVDAATLSEDDFIFT